MPIVQVFWHMEFRTYEERLCVYFSKSTFHRQDETVTSLKKLKQCGPQMIGPMGSIIFSRVEV